MLGHTHAAAGLCAAAAVLAVLHAPLAQYPLALVAGAAAAFLPDIDEPHSTISRRLIIVGPAIGSAVRHRTATHSIAALVALTLGLRGVWPGVPAPLLWSVAAGFASHLVTDALTPDGAMWFWPLTAWKVTFVGWLPHAVSRVFATGGALERVFWRPAFVLGALALTLSAGR